MKHLSVIAAVILAAVLLGAGFYAVRYFQGTRLTPDRLNEIRQEKWEEELAARAAAEDTTSEEQAEGASGEEEEPGESIPDLGEDTPPEPVKPDAVYHAAIQTNKGPITIALFPDVAPKAVVSFVNLAQRGFYDGLTFHRYVEGFVIQGGCPKGTGAGSPGYRYGIEVDPALNYDRKGMAGVARSKSKESNGCQFFITLDPAPQLNQDYTIFGQVREGMNVAESLRKGDVIRSISIEPSPDELLDEHADLVAEWTAAMARMGY